MAVIDLSQLPPPQIVDVPDFETLLSAIYAALHVQGVQRVELMKPLADMVLDKTQASYCTDFKAEIGGSDD